jgi:hypothetical protein
MAHEWESCMMEMTAQFMDRAAAVHAPVLLVIPVRVYHLVVALQWVKTSKLEIDNATTQ